MSLPLLIPDWPTPPGVRAVVTTRFGGVSEAPFKSLNLGDHVGDEPKSVAENRARLADALGMPNDSFGWIRQVHGTDLVQLPGDAGSEADAAWTRERRTVCAILTADCLPALFCSQAGDQIAAAHAGWRGLAGGVLENTLAAFPSPGSVRVWLGPAIGQDAFQVGPEVRDVFVEEDPALARAFQPSVRPGYFLADLCALARARLLKAGVPEGQIYGGEYCTYSDIERFYSYRRDGQTGRMASLIWLE
ncbi:peptidoglycan editing factor PgeF [Marinobacter sp. JSM 1782161]|uniref:peptidoglycan editing factor PgeF n=1 Tax=Marinobacter sp. JSM 1782161 TaxID=2685906 RepID=UPI0014030284|nr:peptidoglycan editing factor PgeF [Marinobacter sp. JSM 1782161]